MHEESVCGNGCGGWLAVSVAVGSVRCGAAVYPAPAVPRGVAVARFPRVLSVVGFVGAALLPSPPSLSVHHVVPLPPNTPQQQQAEADAERGVFALLQRALECEHQHALVALDHDWFAVLAAQPVRPLGGSTTRALLLHVLAPGTALPGSGGRVLTTHTLCLCTGPHHAPRAA